MILILMLIRIDLVLGCSTTSARKSFCLSPQQLGQLLYDMRLEREENKIVISSDDDLNALTSLLIHSGAKVEMFSAHDHPHEEHGR